jgi:prepilin-type N-terminal cleavage/methylation domain-containing protein
MYKKNFGVSLIELLVTMVISVILAGISIPNMTNWYKKDQFISQADKIADAIYTVRTNALSEKKCTGGTSSNYWIFSIKKETFSIFCNDTKEKEFSINKNLLLNTVQDVSSTEPGIDKTIDNSFIANIKIFSGSGQSKIYFDSESFVTKKIKLSLVFNEDNTITRTLCFNRVSGFATTSLNFNCDD